MTLPSLDLIYGEVSAELNSRTDAIQSLDTKIAGVLAFAGAIVAFAPSADHTAVRIGRLVAVLAAVVAMVAFDPRKFPALKPTHLRTYIVEDESDGKLRMLDVKIEMSEQARLLIRDKARKLRCAIILGAVAVVFVAIGSWSGTTSEGKTWAKTTTTSPTNGQPRSPRTSPTSRPSSTSSVVATTTP